MFSGQAVVAWGGEREDIAAGAGSRDFSSIGVETEERWGAAERETARDEGVEGGHRGGRSRKYQVLYHRPPQEGSSLFIKSRHSEWTAVSQNGP